jgi:hypothetical protein
MGLALRGYGSGMDALQVVWGASLVVTLVALPMGLVRMLAYRSREVDHTRTMLVAAWVALGLGLAGLLGLAVTTTALLA